MESSELGEKEFLAEDSTIHYLHRQWDKVMRADQTYIATLSQKL